MKRKDLFLFIALLLILAGCAGTKLIRSSMSPEILRDQAKHTKLIKIHLRDGGLYVLDDWTFNNSSDSIIGFGAFYNYRRNLVSEKWKDPSINIQKANHFSIPGDKIALIETNKLKSNIGNLAAITIVGVPYAITTIYCLTNPKACFGSCPTFYALKNGQWTLMAEGFSSSIAPSFEKKDIDMLYWADEARNEMSLKLTNEALETHVIRYVDLLTFPKSDGEQVFATEKGQFYRTSKIVSPVSCVAEEGDCLNLIKEMDRNERFCGVDPKNLSRKEEITLTFNNDSQSELGFLIGSKQTLLTTHLFYQVMAYTGNYYGSLVAEVENGNSQLKKRIQKLWDQLGGIEIFLLDKNKKWEKIDEITEMGPIASDVHLVKLPPVQQGKITLKLRLTKGLWRIDYLALAKIIGEETPIRIKPDLVLKNDTVDHEAMIRLIDGVDPVVTFPGDEYELKYRLSDDCSYQFFLETKGYYMEWMRDEWLAEENLKKAAFAFYFPGLFMRKAAPAYKKVEPKMEKVFWESRYVKQ